MVHKYTRHSHRPFLSFPRPAPSCNAGRRPVSRAGSGVARQIPRMLVCVLMMAGPAVRGDPVEQGRALYQQHCAACHGENAKGHDALLPRPADLTKIAQRRDGVWPMLEVMSIIDGYTKTQTPRDGMPVIAALTQGTKQSFDTGNGQTVLVPERLVALAVYLETIQSPKPERAVP